MTEFGSPAKSLQTNKRVQWFSKIISGKLKLLLDHLWDMVYALSRNDEGSKQPSGNGYKGSGGFEPKEPKRK
jgi:hypothetical protein